MLLGGRRIRCWRIGRVAFAIINRVFVYEDSLHSSSVPSTPIVFVKLRCFDPVVRVSYKQDSAARTATARYLLLKLRFALSAHYSFTTVDPVRRGRQLSKLIGFLVRYGRRLRFRLAYRGRRTNSLVKLVSPSTSVAASAWGEERRCIIGSSDWLPVRKGWCALKIRDENTIESGWWIDHGVKSAWSADFSRVVIE